MNTTHTIDNGTLATSSAKAAKHPAVRALATSTILMGHQDDIGTHAFNMAANNKAHALGVTDAPLIGTIPSAIASLVATYDTDRTAERETLAAHPSINTMACNIALQDAAHDNVLTNSGIDAWKASGNYADPEFIMQVLGIVEDYGVAVENPVALLEALADRLARYADTISAAQEG